VLANNRHFCHTSFLNITHHGERFTNIFLAVALNEPDKENIIQLTAEASAISPEILPYEVGNALTAMVKRKQLTSKEALATLYTVNTIPVRLISVDIEKTLELALKYKIICI